MTPLRSLALLTFLLSTSCSTPLESGDDAGVCAPGRSESCTCINGRPGAQVCLADASGFDACECAAAVEAEGEPQAGGEGGPENTEGEAEDGGDAGDGEQAGPNDPELEALVQGILSDEELIAALVAALTADEEFVTATQGEVGIAGSPGSKGDRGGAGARGDLGPAGERGPAGDPGGGEGGATQHMTLYDADDRRVGLYFGRNIQGGRPDVMRRIDGRWNRVVQADVSVHYSEAGCRGDVFVHWHDALFDSIDGFYLAAAAELVRPQVRSHSRGPGDCSAHANAPVEMDLYAADLREEIPADSGWNDLTEQGFSVRLASLPDVD